ncbi:MAG: type I restriction-modification system subunit M [Coriobacteriales bacterium]|jgi:type I restriction enzyme M protein|nr:type I restriction-modification system subunit M [Coriobacteriales bacterium]
MVPNTSNINAKIWSMATVLMNDGVSNSDYLEQLTYLLFLKMAEEYSNPPFNRDIGIPDDCRWQTLVSKKGDELDRHYTYILTTLAEQRGTLQQIYTNAKNMVSTPAMLARIIKMIADENWSSMSADVKGDIYEGLLQKVAEDTKSGAGQYFTPRSLTSTMVACVRPQPNRTVADPCCGSGGFLLATKDYIEDNFSLDRDQKQFLKFKTFRGWEIVPRTYRMCLMNLFLHNISDFDGVPPIERNDSLTADPGERFDYVLTNPPFGKKSSLTYTNEEGGQSTEDLVYNRQDFWATSSNKQLNFVQHIHTLLKTGGTAAVVVPDNVLFEGGAL